MLLRFQISIILFHLLILINSNIYSQTIEIGSINDEKIKLQILLNDSLFYPSVNKPFSINPIHYNFHVSSEQKWWERPIFNEEFEIFQGMHLGILPTTFQNTINSRLPYGENNQSSWYGRGNNLEFSSGFYLRSSYFTLQIQPIFSYSQNVDFLNPRFISRDNNGQILYRAEVLSARLDNPFRFGPDPFTVFDLGNSSLRFHYKKFDIGISTEPLWWGPTVRYPLIMSNNSAGIPHFFIGTNRPVLIPYFGYIQMRWMNGYPGQSKYYDGVGADETRFFSAINFAYSPVFFPNITFGITRAFHLYEVDGFDIRNMARIFDPFSKSVLIETQGGDTVRQDRNQIASFYLHLSLPEANAEVYAEYFREDHSYNFRDLFMQPHHNSAYGLGFQKISFIPWFDFLKTNLEFTNLTNTQLEQVRRQTNYYTHSKIRQGHTNRGQLLGAAIGAGSNSQYLSFDLYKGNFRYGIFGQRVVDNDNFHFEQGSASLTPSRDFGDYFRHRVDLNVGLNFLYGPGPYYFHSKLTWTRAYNYGRFDYGKFFGVDITNFDKIDRTNIQFQMGISFML